MVVEALAALFEQVDGDWQRFHARVESLGRVSADERAQVLVEAVIAERINRLDEPLQELLRTAYFALVLMDGVGAVTLGAVDRVYRFRERRMEKREEEKEAQRLKEERIQALNIERKKSESRTPPTIQPKVQKIEKSERVEKEKQVTLFEPDPNTELPPFALLDEPRHSGQQLSDEALKGMSRLLELKLADFKIDASVVAVHPGPVVTLFELDLAAGTKASKVSALASDLARVLSTLSVCVV